MSSWQAIRNDITTRAYYDLNRFFNLDNSNSEGTHNNHLSRNPEIVRVSKYQLLRVPKVSFTSTFKGFPFSSNIWVIEL